MIFVNLIDFHLAHNVAHILDSVDSIIQNKPRSKIQKIKDLKQKQIQERKYKSKRGNAKGRILAVSSVRWSVLGALP